MVYSNRFDEGSDLITTYLGRTTHDKRNHVNAEKKFLISGQRFTVGKLLDDTVCQILLDTGVSKSYMSKVFYL